MGQDNLEETNYDTSPEMICVERRCTTENADSLKKMDFDTRWNKDNRIPTWNFGMMNFGFDQNFTYGGNAINLTDDEERQTITEDSEEEEGVSRKVTGHRRMAYNGNWFKIQ